MSHDIYETIRKTPDSQLRVMILQHLKEFFPNDPFSYGSFSEIAGNSEMRARFSEPEGNIIFAGENTSVDFNAFVYGAFMSGKRAASQVLKMLEN